MKNKRIFAVSSPKDRYIFSGLHGIFCAMTSSVYYCIYTLRYRLLPFIRSRDFSEIRSVFGETKGDSLSYIPNLILILQCQRQEVSGPQRITVAAILRQQRDSLHHATQLATLQATSRSREWTAHATLSSSQSPSISTNFSLVPNGSASSTSATGGSSSPSKPPE